MQGAADQLGYHLTSLRRLVLRGALQDAAWRDPESGHWQIDVERAKEVLEPIRRHRRQPADEEGAPDVVALTVRVAVLQAQLEAKEERARELTRQRDWLERNWELALRAAGTPVGQPAVSYPVDRRGKETATPTPPRRQRRPASE